MMADGDCPVREFSGDRYGSAPATQTGKAGIQERTLGERTVVRLNQTPVPTRPSSPLADDRAYVRFT